MKLYYIFSFDYIKIILNDQFSINIILDNELKINMILKYIFKYMNLSINMKIHWYINVYNIDNKLKIMEFIDICHDILINLSDIEMK